jgi:hypothetical protein
VIDAGIHDTDANPHTTSACAVTSGCTPRPPAKVASTSTSVTGSGGPTPPPPCCNDAHHHRPRGD